MIMSREYNKIPVIACKKCLSLAIRCDELEEPADEGVTTEDYNYCLDCGSVETVTYTLNTWENKYEAMHGVKFMEIKNG